MIVKGTSVQPVEQSCGIVVTKVLGVGGEPQMFEQSVAVTYSITTLNPLCSSTEARSFANETNGRESRVSKLPSPRMRFILALKPVDRVRIYSHKMATDTSFAREDQLT